MPAPKVAFQRVERRYGAVTALARLDLEVAEGEFLTLLGPSGCGKTTTLRILAGFVDPTAGRVTIDGRDVVPLPPNKRDVGMVFQNYALFPHMTVAENIGFGMKQRGASPGAIAKRVAQLLDLIKMPELGGRHPGQLSGGQRQRVAIARAVAHPPRVLLMDEPLGALDLKLRESMQQELRAIQRALGITTLYVTHDQTEAMVMSDRIVVMNAGRVEQTGTPTEIYMRPATRFVASFVGRLNLLPSEANAPMAKGVRPEWMRILAPGAAVDGLETIEGRVCDSIFVGTHVSLIVDVGRGLTISVDGQPADGLPVPGDDIRIGWEPGRAIALANS